MNHMYEVAKFLGVELYEAFTITFPPPSTHHAVVMLTEAGAKVIDTDVFDVLNFNSYLLERLIKGTYGIERICSKYWKPKFNDKYYSIGVDGTVEDGTWLNDFLDYTLYKVGNCYRTVEEAKENRLKWGTFYDTDEVLDIE